MKKIFLLNLFLLLLQIAVRACGGLFQNVYSADIAYKVNPANPLTCDITVMLDFDIPDNLRTDSILIDWGDGDVHSIFASDIHLDTLANLKAGFNRYYTHIYEGTHTYASLPDSGFYVVSIADQFRVSNINNIYGGNVAGDLMYIEACIVLDTAFGFSNRAPLLAPATIGFASVDSAFLQSNFLYDPDNDSVSFDFIVPRENRNSVVYAYMFPDSFCNELGYPDTLTINHVTGEIAWVTPCQQGIFTIATIARKYRQGRFIGSIIRDQNIYVSIASASGILSPDAANNGVSVFPNPAIDKLSGRVQNDLQKISVSIMSVSGTVLLKDISVAAGRFDADVSSLSAGLYFVRIGDGFQSVVKKFVKQ